MSRKPYRLSSRLLRLSVAAVVTFSATSSLQAQDTRQVLDVKWELLWRVPPSLDSFLMSPGLVVADRDGFLIFDYGDLSVKRVAPGGELDWTYGREGQGPGEFSGAQWLSVTGDTVWHSEGLKVTVLTTRGDFVRTFRVPGMLRAVPLLEGGGLAVMSGGPLLLHFDGEGTPLRSWSPEGFPEDLTSLEREVLPSSDDQIGTILLAFVRSGRLSVLVPRPGTGYDARMIDGIEPFDFGRAVSWTHESGVRVTRIDPRVPEGALDIARSDRHFHVFFMGESENRGRLVDLYDRRTGGYAGSLVLPETVRSIAVTSDGAIAGLIDDPVPHLKVWAWEARDEG